MNAEISISESATKRAKTIDPEKLRIKEEKRIARENAAAEKAEKAAKKAAEREKRESKKQENKLKKIERKLKAERPALTPSDDPIVNLKLLVNRHTSLTKTSVGFINQSSDKRNKVTGELIPNFLPDDVRMSLQELAKKTNYEASVLERDMLRELRKVPIYNEFLSKVYGMGPITSAYLISSVLLDRAVKPSQLVRYAGYAVINGTLERRSEGPKYDKDGNLTGAGGTFNKVLRTRLWQSFGSMFRTGSRKETRYLRRWRDKREYVYQKGTDNKIITSAGRKVSAKDFAMKTGLHAAVTLFLHDLHMIWCALEGRDCYPSYHEWHRGEKHAGNMELLRDNEGKLINIGRKMTVEEAWKIIGDVGVIRERTEEEIIAHKVACGGEVEDLEVDEDL